MGGVYRQYGGQVIRGFILEISFLDKKSYDLIVLLKRIESFGFELGGGDKNNSYLFCKGNRGFWITKRPKLTIYYENKMSDCMK
ncbi:hypothetical protein B0188_11210 [[Haemophilus] felis]|uniref:Uncharacterized protein n=1 Tax=[Haemophilus] felis TaxID=123822 RepID=A0A1T0AS19_9PAST|nr:hypothetical protein B0188_11210 [[Haemophilus] felis]